jgi:hypothetical protein
VREMMLRRLSVFVLVTVSAIKETFQVANGEEEGPNLHAAKPRI